MMKKIYVKPQTCVIEATPSELCYFSKWNVDDADKTTTPTDIQKVDFGNVVYDKNQWGTDKKSDDPWNSDNW